MAMGCEELLAALAEYVDGEIDPATAAAIRGHLEKCPTCELVVDNLRKTISVYCADPEFEMPPELERHLDGLLRDQWKAKFASGRIASSDEAADGNRQPSSGP